MLPMSRMEATIFQAVCLMLLTIVSEALYSYRIQMCADYNNASDVKNGGNYISSGSFNASHHSVGNIIFVLHTNVCRLL